MRDSVNSEYSTSLVPAKNLRRTTEIPVSDQCSTCELPAHYLCSNRSVSADCKCSTADVPVQHRHNANICPAWDPPSWSGIPGDPRSGICAAPGRLPRRAEDESPRPADQPPPQRVSDEKVCKSRRWTRTGVAVARSWQARHKKRPLAPTEHPSMRRVGPKGAGRDRRRPAGLHKYRPIKTMSPRVRPSRCASCNFLGTLPTSERRPGSSLTSVPTYFPVCSSKASPETMSVLSKSPLPMSVSGGAWAFVPHLLNWGSRT